MADLNLNPATLSMAYHTIDSLVSKLAEVERERDELRRDCTANESELANAVDALAAAEARLAAVRKLRDAYVDYASKHGDESTPKGRAARAVADNITEALGTEVSLAPTRSVDLIRHAIANPGLHAPRGDKDAESITSWQARAVLAALAVAAGTAQPEAHGMIPGSHERAGGPECRCGVAWNRGADRCAAQPDEEPTEPEWRCRRCRSPRWVAASLNGGATVIRQCVPCGHYSGDRVPAQPDEEQP